MTAPPAAKPGRTKSVNGGEPIGQSLPAGGEACQDAGISADMRAEYRLLCEVQAQIERAFWAIEQRKGQLADQLANEGIKPFCRPRNSGHLPSKRKLGFQP